MVSLDRWLAVIPERRPLVPVPAAAHPWGTPERAAADRRMARETARVVDHNEQVHLDGAVQGPVIDNVLLLDPVS